MVIQIIYRVYGGLSVVVCGTGFGSREATQASEAGPSGASSEEPVAVEVLDKLIEVRPRNALSLHVPEDSRSRRFAMTL